MIELHVPVCLVHDVYNGEKHDYISVNTPDGDSVLVWGNKVSIKSKVKSRIFKNGLSIQLIDPQIKAVD